MLSATTQASLPGVVFIELTLNLETIRLQRRVQSSSMLFPFSKRSRDLFADRWKKLFDFQSA